MNETKKTVAFVLAALLLGGLAAVASIPRTRTVEAFNDQGEEFFPEFKDPMACTSLEVVEFDAETASARPFKVMLKDGRWVIPSHYDYPADAKDRLSKTAAQVIGLRKDAIRSSRAEDHESLGVLDPLEAKAAKLEGVGKRITLRDPSDRVLADYIIGKNVPGRIDQKFVRRPGQARTYAVTLKAEPSTRFADWIETNLLKLDSSKLRKVVFDNHKIDPDRGQVVLGDVLTIERKDGSAPWTMAGLSDKEEVDPAKTSTLASTLGDLAIVGVRPKPAGLSAELTAKEEGKSARLDREARASLASKGFHIVQGGTLMSNEGDVFASTSDGVTTILRFGEVTFARGEALTSGAGDSSATADPKAAKDASKPQGDTVESRYLFVTAQFDPKLIEAPTPPDQTPAEGALPSNVFQKSGEELKAELTRYESEKSEYERKLKEGKATADALTNRFAPWYYVVPGDAYRSVVLDRKTLIHPKPDPSAAPPGMQGFPSLPGGANPFGPGRGNPHGLR